MSATMSYVDAITHEQTVNAEIRAESRSNDEFFENLVDIINENFVLEVEDSLELRI